MEQTRPTGKSLALDSKKMGRIVWCESHTERRFFSYLDRMPEVLYVQEQPVAIGYSRNKRRPSYHALKPPKAQSGARPGR
jgi:hypothetical protein